MKLDVFLNLTGYTGDNSQNFQNIAFKRDLQHFAVPAGDSLYKAITVKFGDAEALLSVSSDNAKSLLYIESSRDVKVNIDGDEFEIKPLIVNGLTKSSAVLLKTGVFESVQVINDDDTITENDAKITFITV